MLSLKDVRQWIAGLGIAEDAHVYIGKLDNKQQKSIGVYARKGSGVLPTLPGLFLFWFIGQRASRRARQRLISCMKNCWQ